MKRGVYLIFSKITSWREYDGKRGSLFMNMVTHLNSDDYLDLYLVAKKMGDQIWQNEIMTKLRDVMNERATDIQSLNLEGLWENYKKINREIVALYRNWFDGTAVENETIHEEIMVLKQERHAIGRQMDLAKGMDYYNKFK
jgi:hypothetical protein